MATTPLELNQWAKNIESVLADHVGNLAKKQDLYSP